MADAAVRAGRARRARLRARRDRRQGAGVRRARDRAAFHAQTGALPLNVRFLIEGEEEVGSPEPRPRFLRGTSRGARGRPRRLRRRRDVAGERAVDRDRREGPARAEPRRNGPGAPTCTRAGTAARCRIRTTHSRRSSRACTTPDGSVAVAGFYDGVDTARRRRPGSTRAGAVRRGGVPLRRRGARAARRARLHDARAAVDATDARGERASRRRPVHGHPAKRAGARHVPPRARPAPGRRARRDRGSTFDSVAPQGVEVARRGGAGRRSRLRDRRRPSGGARRRGGTPRGVSRPRAAARPHRRHVAGGGALRADARR